MSSLHRSWHNRVSFPSPSIYPVLVQFWSICRSIHRVRSFASGTIVCRKYLLVLPFVPCSCHHRVRFLHHAVLYVIFFSSSFLPSSRNILPYITFNTNESIFDGHDNHPVHLSWHVPDLLYVRDTLGWIPHYSGRLPQLSLVCVCVSIRVWQTGRRTYGALRTGGRRYVRPNHTQVLPHSLEHRFLIFFFVGEWTGSINRYQYETFISIRHRHKGLGGNGTGLAIRSGLSVKVVVAFPTVAWNVEHPVASLLCHRAVTTCLHKHDQ